jgi:hypothetical protein
MSRIKPQRLARAVIIVGVLALPASAVAHTPVTSGADAVEHHRGSAGSTAVDAHQPYAVGTGRKVG